MPAITMVPVINTVAIIINKNTRMKQIKGFSKIGVKNLIAKADTIRYP